MGRVWQVANVSFIVLGVTSGYSSMEPSRLRHTNPDPILCLILLVVVPAFALGAVYFSIQRSRKTVLPHTYKLRRPSWDRSPINWWDDPLQSLFIATCIMAGMVAGAALRWTRIGSVGFWTVGVYCSFALGLTIGQFLVYRVYREFLA